MQKFRSFKNLALASLFLVKSSLLAPVHTFGQVDDALAEMRNHIQTILVNKTHVENTVGGCEKEVATIRAKLQQAQTDAIAAAKQQFTNEYDALQTMQQDLSHEMAVVNAHIENAEATIRTKADEIRQSNEARLQTALQTHRANFDDLKDSVYEDLEGVIDQAEKEAREVRDRQWSEFQASKSRIDNACEAESKVRRQRFDQELEKIEAVKKDVTEKVLDGLRETVEQAFNTGELTRDTLNKLPEIMADAVGTAVDAASKDSSKSFGDALKENFSPEMVKALSDEKVGKNFGKSLIDGMVNSTAFKDMVKKMTEDAAKGKAEGWVGGNIEGAGIGAAKKMHWATGLAGMAAATLAIAFGGPFILYKWAKKEIFTPKVLTKVKRQGECLNAGNYVGTPEMLHKLGTVNDLLRSSAKHNKDCFHFLLVGPPGVGKTEFTRYLGDETGLDVYYFNMKNLPSGQKGVDLFQQIDAVRRGGKFRRPSIMVVDEADMVILSRKAGSGKHDQHSQTILNALLQATGSEEKTFQGSYFFITNTPECVDEAILDRSLVVKFEELSQEAKNGLLLAKLGKTLPGITEDKVNNLTGDIFLNDSKQTGASVIENKALRQSLLGIRSGRGISKFSKYLTLKILGTGQDTDNDMNTFKQEFMSFMMDEVAYSERLQIQERETQKAVNQKIIQSKIEHISQNAAAAAA